ncbi:MAG: hypothetical protein KGJ06_09625 [Pseudomonadota bacterium]|nr:hypothetical protein [Pseudomonadota bacterium]
MSILQQIEQAIGHAEQHIERILALREQYVKTEAGEALSDVNNKISGLKAWLEDIRQAIHADKEKIGNVAEDLKKDL